MKRIPAEKPVKYGPCFCTYRWVQYIVSFLSDLCPDCPSHLWLSPSLQFAPLWYLLTKNVTGTPELWVVDTSLLYTVPRNSPLAVCRSTDLCGQLFKAVLLYADKHTFFCKWGVRPIAYRDMLYKILSFIAWCCMKITLVLWNRWCCLIPAIWSSYQVNWF